MKAVDFQAIILAAGKGSRMGADIPKVLIPLCSKPMIRIILDSLSELGIHRPVIVIGPSGKLIEETLGIDYIYALQEQQFGSGHAVSCALHSAGNVKHLLIMCGDSPLFRIETIKQLMDTHISNEATVTLVSAVLDNPHGYGRIIRNQAGEITGVAEEKTATDAQKSIKEINGGCYAFNGDWLRANIGLLSRNEAGEYCLTEMVDIAVSQGMRVNAVQASPDEVGGVNTPDQLKEAEEVLKSRSECK